MTNDARAIETLAAEIGDKVYIDVAKWHLYLEAAKLHVVVAERLYPMLSDGCPNESQILQVLQEIPVALGGGKRELPLAELIPRQGLTNLTDILEEFKRQL